MEKIFFPKISSHVFLLLSPRKVQVISKRTAVDLAHKIHGKCRSTRVTPLIVLHGLLGSKKNWASMSKKLASSLGTCAVVADARNHGESPHENSHSYQDLASDVLQLMDTVGLQKATLIGHSMGGRTAMVVALTRPEKVDRLVVVDISPVSTVSTLSNFFPPLIDAMKSINFDGVKNVNEAKTVAKDQLVASGAVQSADGLDFILMNIAVRSDKSIGWVYNLATLKNSFEYVASFPEGMKGKKFDGKTLFIGGELSNYIPRTDLEGIKRLFPNVELIYIPRVGHNVHAEDPSTFFKVVEQFLSK